METVDSDLKRKLKLQAIALLNQVQGLSDTIQVATPAPNNISSSSTSFASSATAKKKVVLSPELQICKSALTRLKGQGSASPFLEPVDPVALKIPEYFSVISHPMDLGTVSKKLNRGEYAAEDELLADVELIWSNCRLFNGPTHPYAQMADSLSALFKSYLIDERLKAQNLIESRNKPSPQKASGNHAWTSTTKNSKTKPPSDSGFVKRGTKRGRDDGLDGREEERAPKPLDYSEKAALGENLQKLPYEDVVKAIELIGQTCPAALGNKSDDVELDIEKLDVATGRRVQQFVAEALGRSSIPKR